MRNFYKYFKRIEVTKGMLYVMYAVAFYIENRDNVDKWQIKQIQPIICNTNTKYINCITQRYSQKCVIIFDPKEPILRHMKSYRNKFVFLSFPKGTAILKVVNMKNLSNELKYYNKESIYVFLNEDYLEHYKTIIDLSLKCYIMPKLLCNMNFAEKSSAIAKINKILTENFCWRNRKRLENYGIDIVRSKYALTIHNKPFVHDDMAFSFTHLNKHKYFSDLDCAISVYRALQTMFFDKVAKITAYKDKIEFIDDVVTSALRILLNNNIMKKEVDLLKYPEIVSYLFPGKFLDTDKDYLSYDEMIRFCCSFTRLKHFIGYQEFFDAQNVEFISARLPEIYFSYIITRNTK